MTDSVKAPLQVSAAMPTGHVLQRQEGRIEFVLAALACMALCVGMNAVMGRDVNWDYANYHGYAAQSALQDRISQDFWAAAVQGYLNPLPFLPFALMQLAGWPSLAIATAIAAFQSLGLLALYGLSRHLASGIAHPRLAATLMTALGAASPVVVSQIGSTFIDATTAPLVMVGLWLLVARPGLNSACAAAALVGAATALKWTNAPFAAGILAAAILATPAQSLSERLRLALWAGGSLLIGFCLSYGWWGLRLWQEHGSPLYPLFNGIFRSPDAPLESFSYMRFVPQTWPELLSFPFRLVLHDAWVHTEVVAPDLRPALVTLLALALAAGAALRRLRWTTIPALQRSHRDWRAPLVFFGVSLAGWLVTSSNGRYAVPLFYLLGPILWYLLQRLAGASRALVLGGLVLVLQVQHAAEAGSPRWNGRPWTQDWLSAAVPDPLRQEPLLFVLIGRPSGSFLASAVHRDSVFVNPIGTVSLPNEGPGWDRFQALRERFAGRTRVVVTANPAMPPADLRAKLLRQNLVIDRLGLQMDVDSCDRVVVDDQAPLVSWLGPSKAEPMDDLLACRAVLRAPDPGLTASREQAIRIMDAFEARCPKIFSPLSTQVEGSGSVWTAAYGRYDVYLTIDGSGSITYRSDRQIRSELIGTVKSWPEDVARFPCALPLNGRRGIDTLAADRHAPR